jgi:PAS domain S-box-containing protein
MNPEDRGAIPPAGGPDAIVASLLAENETLRLERDRLLASITTDEESRVRREQLLEDQAQLLDLVHEAVVVHDIERGSISFWNPGAEDLYGYPKEEALGRVADQLLDTRFPRALPDIERELLARGSWEGEVVQRRKDGSRIVVATRWAVRLDDAGRPAAIVEVDRDITRAKRDLEAHAELAAIVQGAQDAIVGIDGHGTITTWNPAAERLFGFTAAEAVGRPLTLVLPPGAAGDLAPAARVMRGEAVPPYEAMRTRKDGAALDVVVSLSAIQADGRVIGVSAVFRDITERRKLQRQLAEAQRLAHVGSWEWEIATDQLTWSDELYRLHGLAPDRGPITFERLMAQVHPADREGLGHVIAQALEARARWRFIYRVVAPDGTERYLLALGDVMFDAAGKPARMVGATQDISERVANERLQREKLEAHEQAARLKDQFLGIVSHELRTPINAIMGFASILDDGVAGELTAEQRRYTGRILGSADLLLALVDDLLDLSNIQAGRLVLAREPVDFRALATETVEFLACTLATHRCAVTLDVPEGLPRLEADPRRVRQVLMNFLTNAAKYRDERDCRITVRARAVDGRLLCEIADTGIGIAEADLPRLFKPFSQLDMSNTRRRGGTGIGLSIAKTIVEAHGGEVGVRSTPGVGSTFWFSLPLGEGPR